MDDQQSLEAPPAGGPTWWRRPGTLAGFIGGVAATALVAGLTIATLGAASAQTATPPAVPEAGVAPALPFGGGMGHRGHHGPGFGPGSIHGEFTTAAPGGGYQTIATQFGEVTAVSEGSVTVKSEDGFSRTYKVDDNTLVNAGNDGIADVKKGDAVRVVALVDGESASAVEIFDGTNVERLGRRWRPEPPAQAPAASSSSITPTA